MATRHRVLVCCVAAGASVGVGLTALGAYSLVTTKDGRELRGDVTQVDDHIRIDVNGIITTIPRDQVKSIKALKSIEEEYEDRRSKLGADDSKGHFELARWCERNKRFDLVVKQCEYILQIEPANENASLLLQLAKHRLEEADLPKGKPRPVGPPEPVFGGELAGQTPVLTPQDVQKLRFAEVGTRRSERISLRFSNRVAQRFWETMQDDEEFQRQWPRTRFFRLRPHQQLRLIKRWTGDQFSTDIEINSDPYVFQEFKSRVLPIVTRGCASIKCHGGPEARGFRLHTDPTMSTEVLYTNFLILDNYEYTAEAGVEAERPHQEAKKPEDEDVEETGRRKVYRMIDRDRPEYSLLLEYGLPGEVAESPHPTPPEFIPVFRNRRDRQYQIVLNWISALQLPRPDYGIEHKARAGPADEERPPVPEAAEPDQP